MKKKLLFICGSILLIAVSVSLIRYAITPKIPKNEEPILKMLYQESSLDQPYYVRLFKTGEYEIYRGARFPYPDQPFDLSLWFYDVKARRLGQKDMEYILADMNYIKANYAPDPHMPENYSAYAAADIYGARYVVSFSEDDNKEFKEDLYELYSVIADAVPKIWFYNGQLRQYDENGKICPAGDFITSKTMNEKQIR